MKFKGRIGLLASIFVMVVMAGSYSCFGAQTNLFGPAGSAQFGSIIQLLPNGNIVVVDSKSTNSGVPQAGAVYLYNTSLHLVSVLTGSSPNDQIGSGGVRVLSNGNFVVSSPNWNNGTSNSAGAATWCSGSGGLNGAVSSGNSLVGGNANDHVGATVTALANGNYVVSNPFWHGQNGAVTCCNGSTGMAGVVSSLNSQTGFTYDEVSSGGITALSNGAFVVCSPYVANSAGEVSWCSGIVGVGLGYNNSYLNLTGSLANDEVGSSGVVVLPNNDYLVLSPNWNYLGSAAGAGAVTWCNGSTGFSGDILLGQSLMGGQSNQHIGSGGVAVLANTNYVVLSPYWNNSTGAITWCNGKTGLNTQVGSNNSLTGSIGAIVTLTNGNYVVNNPYWNNGSTSYVGAVTFCSGTAATAGAVSAANSLVGSIANDQVGVGGITLLSNGNYVVCSQYWSNQVGAVTWCSGVSGRSGVVTKANSLIGSAPGDQVGIGSVAALANGNYVVCSPAWSNNLGAATWCLGTAITKGLVSGTNSLIGNSPGDQAGLGGVTSLSNSNYVVCSPGWANNGATNAGAITWCNGSSGLISVISSTNSLVGDAANDQIGSYKLYTYSPYYPPPNGGLTTQMVSAVKSLSNGNYVVESPYWNSAGITNAGAITWGNGTIGLTGVVSSANSLVGSSSNDWVGSRLDYLIYNTPLPHYISFRRPAITVLNSGNYVACSPDWNNGTLVNAGAVTWCSGFESSVGSLSSANSLVGGTALDNVGNGGVPFLTNGDYIVISTNWNNGASTNVGAISWCYDPTALNGLISSSNSIIGGVSGAGSNMVFAYDYVRERIVVGSPADNLVAVLNYRTAQTISFPPIPSQRSPGTLTLSATSSAGLPVSFAVLSGAATLNGNQLSLNGVGNVSIVASQAGNSSTLPAPSVTNSFSVTARVIQIGGSTNGLNLSSQGFHLQVNGLTSHGNVIIYNSTNLKDWQPLFTNPPITGSLQFLDTNAADHSTQFYRASEQ